MAITDIDSEYIKTILKYYTPTEYEELNDYNTIIERVSLVKDNINHFHLAFMDLYFNDNMTILEYGNVHIIDDLVYYDFNDYSGEIEIAGTFTLLGKVINND